MQLTRFEHFAGYIVIACVQTIRNRLCVNVNELSGVPAIGQDFPLTQNQHIDTPKT